jgi:hypothetical protein
MLRWARSALPLDQEVLVLADQGLWSPRLWHAIRSQQFHPYPLQNCWAAGDGGAKIW